jgi:hypothetical protein
MIRVYALRTAAETRQIGAAAEVVQRMLVKSGIKAGVADVEDAFEYLSGKGLVAVKKYENKRLDVRMHVAYITPLGTDVLEGTVIVEGIEL